MCGRRNACTAGNCQRCASTQQGSHAMRCHPPKLLQDMIVLIDIAAHYKHLPDWQTLHQCSFQFRQALHPPCECLRTAKPFFRFWQYIHAGLVQRDESGIL